MENGHGHSHDFIYVFWFEGGYVKIGLTNHVPRRLIALKGSCPLQHIKTRAFSVLNSGIAERLLQSYFEKQWIRNEWFKFIPEEDELLTREDGFSLTDDQFAAAFYPVEQEPCPVCEEVAVRKASKAEEERTESKEIHDPEDEEDSQIQEPVYTPIEQTWD